MLNLKNYFSSLFVRLPVSTSMSLLEERTSCKLVSSSRFPTDIRRCLSKAVRPAFIHLLNVYLCCCNSVLGRRSFRRSVSELCCQILACHFPSSPVSSICSDSDFHFRQIAPAPFHVVYVENWSIEVSRRRNEAKLTVMFSVCLQACGLPNQSSAYAFERCRKQFERCGVSLSYSSTDVEPVAFCV